MMSKVFIDTNILVYCIDDNNIKKKNKCRTILHQIESENVGVISTQVLQEYYVTLTKKFTVDPILVKKIIDTFQHFEIVTISFSIIKDAIDCHIVNKISFWDSLIITCAKYAECEKILTEDLNHMQVLDGVQIINPFL